MALCATHRLQAVPTDAAGARTTVQPDFDGVNYSVGIARLLLGQFVTALATTQREPNEDYRLRGLALVYSALQRRGESDAALNALQEKFASSDAYGIAEVRAYRGEPDDAMRWLERAYRQHDPQMLYVTADPLLQNLHHDQRFQALLARMGLRGTSTRPDAVRS